MQCYICPVCFASLEKRKGLREGMGFCPDCMDYHPLSKVAVVSRVVYKGEDTSRLIRVQ
ncbi:MAG: hypothetical protein IJT54_01840 [Candidatus Methanomethylophilaceae archaeon]|nr:hypothetical protein [Candidatus Methanomethylophilaceae archaeon]